MRGYQIEERSIGLIQFFMRADAHHQYRGCALAALLASAPATGADDKKPLSTEDVRDLQTRYQAERDAAVKQGLVPLREGGARLVVWTIVIIR